MTVPEFFRASRSWFLRPLCSVPPFPVFFYLPPWRFTSATFSMPMPRLPFPCI